MAEVLLINANDNIALGMSRGLSRAGVEVAGVCWPGGGVGRYTRHLDQRYEIPGLEELRPELLLRLLEKSGARVVMAAGEHVLTHLNQMRDDVPHGVRFLFPPQPILSRALDKARTLETAARMGIDVPRGVEVAAGRAWDAGLDGLTYPVVLKMAFPVNLPRGLDYKYRYADDAGELGKLLADLAPHRARCLVQEFVPGHGRGVELCLWQGRVAAAFQHRRLHELPPGGGISIYCRAEPLEQDLLEQAVALLRAMEWQGVAMVEFRCDPASGRRVLMEVNGRFWGSIHLALAAGVNFPHALFDTWGRGHGLEPAPYDTEAHAQMLGLHLVWLRKASITRRDLPPGHFPSRARALGEFLGSFGPKVKFYLEDRRDPWPGAMWWARQAPPAARFMGRRWESGAGRRNLARLDA